MSVARGLGGTFWWPSWKMYTRGKQTGYSGERATLHALTCFEFLFLLHSPRSFRLMPCKYYVKTSWNTTFLLYNPSFMFTFNDQSNKSINYDYWLFVRQFPNEQSPHKWFLHLFVFKKASLNIIRNSLPFFFLNKNYMLMLLYWIKFCNWIWKKKKTEKKNQLTSNFRKYEMVKLISIWKDRILQSIRMARLNSFSLSSRKWNPMLKTNHKRGHFVSIHWRRLTVSLVPLIHYYTLVGI